MQNNESEQVSLRRENSSSSLPLETTNVMVLPSNQLSQNVATEQSRSLSEHSTQCSKILKRKDSLFPEQEPKSAQKDAIESESISALPMKEKLSWQTFSPIKRNCCPGTDNGCYKLITTYLVVEPVGFLFLDSAYFDTWTGDLCKKRLAMKNNGYRVWFISLFDILWAADLSYRSIVARIRLFFP